ncbi:MAG: hypothetical protein MI919_00580 [Holophagales bacterium]|nr:hypothetical protein [Holophagales bacterium]
MSSPPTPSAETPPAAAADAPTALDVRSIERPHGSLLVYYTVVSLLFGPFFPFACLETQRA